MSSAPALIEAAPRSVESATLRSVPAVDLTSDDLDTLRATVFRNATDAQLRLYARNCQSRGLDPFAKEIYAWAGRDGAVEIVVSIDGLRNLAENSGEYLGQRGPFFCGEDGEWTEVWLRKGPPAAAKVIVLRQGREEMSAVALFSEFKRNTPTWNSMPTVMLATRAEAQAIRRQFPRQTGGLYLRDELESGPVIDAQARPARDVDPETGETRQARVRPAAEVDPVKEHTEGWRTYVWSQKQALGISDRDFNGLRKHLKLPLLERMTVEQCKTLNEALLNLPDVDAPHDADQDAAGQGSLPIDVPFDVDGEVGNDRFVNG